MEVEGQEEGGFIPFTHLVILSYSRYSFAAGAREGSGSHANVAVSLRCDCPSMKWVLQTVFGHPSVAVDRLSNS